MSDFTKVICIVLDGVGVGEAPDAAQYGDVGSNSLANTARHVGSLRLPRLQTMGLGNIVAVEGVPAVDEPLAHYGRMQPAAAGKDSTSGHWELMGCVAREPFPTYPQGFPPDIVRDFERRIGRSILGNRPASGTAIIQELGDVHVRTGSPIVYTSQDSVFQIAAHERVVPLQELYRFCEVARSVLVAPHNVARVIARPFDGTSGGYYRTPHRRDFSLAPIGRTLLDSITERSGAVWSIGKVDQLFAGRGVSRALHTRDNRDGMRKILDCCEADDWTFLFANLVDFDTMWGHRNDPRAYALGLEDFDSFMSTLLERLGRDTLLIITSDHGNDPTTTSTDHSREFVPLLVHHRSLKRGTALGVRDTFSDVACTIADVFGLPAEFPGNSFIDLIRGQSS